MLNNIKKYLIKSNIRNFVLINDWITEKEYNYFLIYINILQNFKLFLILQITKNTEDNASLYYICSYTGL